MQPNTKSLCLSLLLLVFAVSAQAGNDKNQANSYDNAWEQQWVNHSRQVLQGGTGKTNGFVLQIGDSITHSNPYSQWPRFGSGKTAEDGTLCTYISSTVMGSGTGDTANKNGFYLAIADTSGQRGMTASSGITAAEILSGNNNGGTAMPSDTTTASAKTKIADGATYTGNIHIDTLIAAFSDAQFAVVMLGTNDANGARTSALFIADLTTIVDKLEARNIVPILSTIPPTTNANGAPLNAAYNTAIRNLAQTRGLALIDYHAEILARRSGTTWQGTLIDGDGIHPTATGGAYSSSSDPYADGGDAASHRTGAACDNVGYLLRSWLTIQKLKEVKSYVIDGNNPPSAGVNSIDVTPQGSSVAAGGSQTFTAVAKDASGNAVVPQPTFTWSVSAGGGTISAAGALTAGTTAGGPFTVTASASGKNGTANFTITALTQVNSVTIAPASKDIALNQSFSFGATAKDIYGNTISNPPAASWMVSGGGSVNSSGTVTAGSTPGGPFTLTATISGKSGTASFTVFEQNNAPLMSSLPTAVPNPAQPGATITLTAFATDFDGDLLSYSWTLGDGSSATGNPVQHAYATPGEYLVFATATDARGASVTNALLVRVIAPNVADLDNDGDGFTNGAEDAAGTNKSNASSFPGGPGDSDGDGIPDHQDTDDDNDGATDAIEIAQGTDPWNPNSFKRLTLVVAKLSGSVKAGGGKDGVSFSGLVTGLPPGFSLTGVTAELRIGTAATPFTFDAKGRAKNAQGSFSIALKPVNKDKATKQVTFLGGDVVFKAKLSKGTFASAWGVDLNGASGMLVLPVTLKVGGYVYGADVETKLDVKAGKQARLKK